MGKLLDALVGIVQIIIRVLSAVGTAIPDEAKNDIIDFIIDRIEKANVGAHPEVVAACKIVRKVINVPDDDIDEENPI